MKKSLLLMGALCVGASFVSCVDDSESDEVKELRQIELNKEKANLDQKYWTMYNNAVANVKAFQGDLATAQQNLDGIKSGNLTHTAAKDAAIAYQKQVIARNQKDIADKEAEIKVQEKLAGKSYEEIQEAKIAADNAKEEADKAAQDYWIDLTNKGYNLSYPTYSGLKTVDVTFSASAKIDMLLGSYLGYDDVKYRNNKLNENAWVKAMNAIYNAESYSYVDGNGLAKTANDYNFSLTDDDDDPGTDYYTATSMFSSQSIDLLDENGHVFQTYQKYTYKDVKKYSKALGEYVKQLKDALDSDKDNVSYKTAYNHYNALKTKVADLVAVLSDDAKSTAYEKLLGEYVGYAKALNNFGTKADIADAIATAYANYSVSNNELTIAGLQDAIKGYNKNIENANKEINEVIENTIVDDATAQKYYETLIAELNSQIEANKAIADKYRSLIVGSESSNNQQQNTPAPAPENAE